MKIYILIIFLLATIRTFSGFVKSVDNKESGSKIFASFLVLITTLIAYIYLCLFFLKLN